MAGELGTEIGSGVGGAAGSLFGPIGTGVGTIAGGLIGSLFNGGSSSNNDAILNQDAAQSAASQDLQEAQQNQQFWNGVYSQFNPTAPTVTATPSAPAYANIANTAKSMFSNSVGANGGPSGSLDQNQVGQNLQTKGTGASKTQDINDFMNDTAQNQQSAEQRELSMFGGTQNQNAENTALYQTAPENAIVGGAQNQSEEAKQWQDYYANQPNYLNEMASGIGTGAGKILGSKASNSLFGNNGQSTTDDQAAEEIDEEANQ